MELAGGRGSGKLRTRVHGPALGLWVTHDPPAHSRPFIIITSRPRRAMSFVRPTWPDDQDARGDDRLGSCLPPAARQGRQGSAGKDDDGAQRRESKMEGKQSKSAVAA